MHIDMNSYFASVEQQANPFLRGKPIGVTGKRYDDARGDEPQRSVVATASIEAKKLGVKTAMSTWEAKRICPSLIMVSGDPEKYGEITRRFNAVYLEFTDKVEQFSVDESFLDVTETARDYLGATVLAQIIRARLKEECGEHITASIGIAPSKLVAKVASESHKPNGLTVVRPENVLSFLAGQELEDFCGIGPRIKRRLEAMGIKTVTELRACPPARLIAEFKSYGWWLHHASFGRDEAPVVPGEEEPKSVGHSYTLAKNAVTADEIKRNLLGLCDKVAWRLRRDGFAARLVTTYLRYSDFSGNGQQHRFQEPTANGLRLFQIAWSLIERWWNGEPVRLVGISAGMLSKGPEQTPLFKKEQKVLDTTSALDRIQTRYGEGSWTRASLLGVEFKPRSSGWHYDHEL